MKKIIITCSMAMLSFLGFGQTARLQIIHNCADPIADSVDVYVNGVLTLNNFAFRTATNYLSLPAATYTVDIAPKTSTSVAQSIFNAALTLTAGTNYTAIAAGVIGGSGATAFNVFVNANSRLAAQTSGNTDLLVFHGSSDAPTVDVTVAGGSPTLVNDAAFGNFSSYIALPTNNYSIEIRDGSGATVVAGYEAPLAALGLQDSSITVCASGFLSPGPGQAAFGLWVALPTGGNLIPLPVSNSRFQVIHNAADLGASVVDVYIDGTLAINNFNFRTATPFLNISSGVVHSIAVAPGTSTSVAQAIATFPVSFTANDTFIVVANGLLSGPPATAFNLYTYAMGREKGVLTGNTDALVFHGSTDAPIVDVTALSGALTLVDDIAYGQFNNGGYLTLPTADYQVDVRDASGTTVVATYDAPLATLNLQDSALVVLASGFLNPSAGQPAFGLWVALAPGGNLIPLPLAVVGVKEFDLDAEVVIYPNPSTDQVVIAATKLNNTAINYSITDLSGKTVFNTIANSNVITVNTSEFMNGSYFVRIMSNEKVITKRFIVSH